MILPELMAAFHKRYPNVTFEIWEGEGARILELLDNRLIEIAITRTQVDNLIYESLVLPNEPLVMVMDQHQSCGTKKDEVSLIELKDQPLIIPLRWKSIFVTNCRRLGFEPKITCVSDSIVQNLLMVKMNLGISMVPMSSKTLLTDGNIIYKRLVEPEMSTHTVVAWLKNQTLSTACKNFLEMFKEKFLSGIV